MYLDLGGGRVVPFRELVGIFDMDRVSRSPRTQSFLDAQERAGRVVSVGESLPLSLVVTREGCYLSPVSPQTLNRRLGEGQMPR